MTTRAAAADAASQIYAALGAPEEEERAWLSSLPDYQVVSFKAAARSTLEEAMPGAPEGARAAVRGLLRYRPADRCVSEAAKRCWLEQLVD